MTYGSISMTTREYVELRARQSNVALEKLAIEPVTDLNPERHVEIAVIVDGALDETFYMDGLYAVNVADWIAEQLREQNVTHQFDSWDVIVTEYAYEDAGPQLYKVTDESNA